MAKEALGADAVAVAATRITRISRTTPRRTSSLVAVEAEDAAGDENVSRMTIQAF